MPSPFKILIAVALGLPPAAAPVGLYVDGGLTAFRRLETCYKYGPLVFKECQTLGNSYWAGGGLAFEVWRHEAWVTPKLELVTDAGFGARAKEVEYPGYGRYDLAWRLLALREYAIFGVEVGGLQPFVGFGGDVAVFPWSLTAPETGIVMDSHRDVKPALALPCGFEYRLTRRLAVAASFEYLTVLGEATTAFLPEELAMLMPDPFIFAGRVRVDL